MWWNSWQYICCYNIVYELDMDAVYILFKGIYVVPYFAYN